MSKRIIYIMVLVLSLMISGCGAKAEKASVASAPAPAAAQSARAAMENSKGVALASDINLNAIDKVIIKNAEANITVKHNSEAERRVQELVVKYQGYIQDTNSYTDKDRSRTDMQVRVPAEKFESFLNDLKDVGEITHNRIFTSDVTEEFIDLSAREKTLKLQEARLQEMLKSAKNVDELLKVENELARIRGEIERIAGRLKYLDNKASYSTVSLHLSTKYIPSEAEVEDFGDQVIYSLKDGFGTFLNVALALIRATAWLLPFAVVLIPVGYFAHKIIRKRPLNK